MKKLISIVIPCYRSETMLAGVVEDIEREMKKIEAGYRYELILVNDCSPDGTFEAIRRLCEASGMAVDEIAAFGDDHVDIGMLKLCGLGIAMENAVREVKEAADLVIGSNQEDGIARYLEGLDARDEKLKEF